MFLVKYKFKKKIVERDLDGVPHPDLGKTVRENKKTLKVTMLLETKRRNKSLHLSRS